MSHPQNGIAEVRSIFSQIRSLLQINHHQSANARLFDILAAIQDVNKLLDEAYKVSQLYNLNDQQMNQEFIQIYDEFGRIKRKITQTFLKQKH